MAEERQQRCQEGRAPVQAGTEDDSLWRRSSTHTEKKKSLIQIPPTRERAIHDYCKSVCTYVKYSYSYYIILYTVCGKRSTCVHPEKKQNGPHDEGFQVSGGEEDFSLRMKILHKA